MTKQLISKMLLCIFLGLTTVANAAEVNAVLEWSDLRKLGTTVSGKVSHVVVKPGMKVKKGDALMSLDQRYFNVQLQQSRAAMEHARLLKEEAEREQERAIELYDRTVLSDYDRQQAEIGLANANAAYMKTKAGYEQSRLDKEYSQLNAPYDAVILNVNAAPGEVVVNETESRVLLEIARADEMLVTTTLDGNQIASLEIGQKIEVAFRGQWTQGEVYSLSLHNRQLGEGYQVAVRLAVESSVNARAGESSALRLPE
jgi:multidrug efflux system membrane fusion protein